MYKREERIVKGVGGREAAQFRTPFSIAVQYPNWLEQQSDGARTEAYGRVKPQSGNPLSSSGTRLEQGDERCCYRLGNIKSPLFVRRESTLVTIRPRFCQCAKKRARVDKITVNAFYFRENGKKRV